MRSCIIPIPRQTLLGWSNQWRWDGSAMWHGVWWENLKIGWSPEVLNVDRRKMFYWDLNRTGGCGLVSYCLGEAAVTAPSAHGNGRSRPINSGTFRLSENCWLPKGNYSTFPFYLCFFGPTVVVPSVWCRKWVQFPSLSKLLFTNRSKLCRSVWRPFSVEPPSYGLIGKNHSSIHSANQLTVLHEKSDVSDITLYKLLYL